MHYTLLPRFNRALIATWLVVALVAALLAGANSLIILAAGLALGAVTGYLQARAIRDNQRSFIAATNHVDVRRALTASVWGRQYTWSIWIGFAALFVIALVTSRDVIAVSMIAGIAAHGIGREALTLRETIQLQDPDPTSGNAV